MIYFLLVINMSFDGVLLHNLISEINILKTGRISKITESGDTDFILTVRVNHKNHLLMISFSSDFARIHLTNKEYVSPMTPKSLTMFLRKHIEGYFIEDIYQYENDRIIVFKVSGYNEMRDFTTKYLICEIMGRYSNLILTDNNYKILEVLKKDGVSEFNRIMLPNATYEFPTSTKLNPYKLSIEQLEQLNITSPKDLCNKLDGISLLMATYIFRNDYIAYNIYNDIRTDINPVVLLDTKNKKDFYFNPLNYETVLTYSSISELLDNFYYEADKQAKIKLKTNDLFTFVNRQINKGEKKIKKLEAEILDAMNSEEYKIKGELLLSYHNLKEKKDKVEVYDYYNNKNIVISLDSKYNVITNSQRFYKKYHKAKTAISYINEQIEITKNEIEYFKIILFQLNNCNVNDAIEIQQELIEHGYMIKKEMKQTRKTKPHFLTYVVDDTFITVGKNNLQNEYITHKLAKSNEYWFHVKDGSGSHVVVHSDELNEILIRTAANLAAYNSIYKESSTVPVDYTQIRNIKKIPGKRNCFVTYTKQKTIYIDPDLNLIESLKVKK